MESTLEQVLYLSYGTAKQSITQHKGDVEMTYSIEYVTEGDGTIVKDISLAEAIDEIINIVTHLSDDDEVGDCYNMLDKQRNIIYTYTVQEERGKCF